MSTDKLAILTDMDEKDIQKTYLLSWENPWKENYLRSMSTCPSPLSGQVAIPFEQCLAVYEKAPDRFIPGYAPNEPCHLQIGKRHRYRRCQDLR